MKATKQDSDRAASSGVDRDEKRSPRRLMKLLVLLALAGAVWIGYAAYRQRHGPRQQFEKARAALKDGNETAARMALDELSGVEEYAPHRHYLRGALLLRKGKFEDARREFQYSRFHPDVELETLVAVGQISYQLGRADEAVRQWSRALAIDESFVPAHRMLARYYYDLGIMPAALKHLEAISILDPEDASALRMIGTIHFDYDNFDEAAKSFRESLRRNDQQPYQDELLNDYAECEMQLRKYESALSLLKRASRMPRQLALMAECHFNLGDREQALKCVNEALELDSNHVRAMLNKGRLLMERGEADAAVETLTKAARLDPKHYEVAYELAQAFRLGGNTEAAKKQNEVVTELKQKYERFSELSARAIDQPQNVGLRIAMGELALELNRAELAREWFRAALYLDPENQVARQRLAEQSGVPTASPAGNPSRP